jgi:uncharacterized membrane protein YgcG
MKGLLMSTRWWVLALCAVMAAPFAHAQQINILRPGDREFIQDLADLIAAEDEQKIRAMADTLLTENAIPIVVVTISSMGDFGYPDWRIETFARTLFDQWGIGHAQVEETSWNRGILLLVSRDDRKARIELGADWGRESDRAAEQIVQEEIIPYFRSGDYSGGIVSGVTALDKLARGVPFRSGNAPVSAGHGSGAGADAGVAGAVGGCMAGIGQAIMLPFILIAGLFSRLQRRRGILRRFLWRRLLRWRRRHWVVVGGRAHEQACTYLSRGGAARD